MAFSDDPIRVNYPGDDSTTSFPTTFKFYDNSHVKAVLRDALDVETVWVEDTDYTLTGAGEDAGGTLIATTAPATGETLVIISNAPATQEKGLPLGGPFPSVQVEELGDLSAVVAAQLKEELSRAIRVRVTDDISGDDLVLPVESDRADMLLGFDSMGRVIATSATAGLPTITPYMETLLDDSDASEALSTLGFSAFGKTLIDDADASAALTTLGFSAFGKTLIDDADAEAARGTIEAAALGENTFTAIQRWAKGADVASAATLNIGTDGNLFDVTGTVTITGITLRGEGTWIALQTNAACTFQHGANLVLPSAADITAVAGDAFIFIQDTATGWRLAAQSKGGSGGATLGENTFTGMQKWDKGADVASAATLNIGTDGNCFDVTGTANITSITAREEGTWIMLKADSTCSFSQSGTLQLPDAQTVNAEANESFLLFQQTATIWRMVARSEAPSLNDVNRFTSIQEWNKGADVASGTNLAIGDDGNSFDVTGIASINTIGAKAEGTIILLQTDAACTFVHSTSLVLPGATNITAAAGEHFMFWRVGATWRLIGRSSLAGASLGENAFTGIQKWDKGADVASATTLNIGTDGNSFDVTGTTTITGITTRGEGTWIILQTDAAVQFTHGANLVLPGGTNITSSAGDVFVFYQDTATGWRLAAKSADATGGGGGGGAPNPNVLINADFNIWQRGTSFTLSNNNDEYTADRWIVMATSSTTGTVSRQAFTVGQTDVDGEPQYYWRGDFTASSSGQGLAQKIEGVRTGAGQSMRLTFWYKKNGTSGGMTVRVSQNFGVGGSTSIVAGSQSVGHSATWVKNSLTYSMPSISGKTIGTDDHVLVEIYKTGSASHILDVARVKFEFGNEDTGWQELSIAQELALCQRYYEKTFPLATAPASSAGVAGALHTLANSDGEAFVTWAYKAWKRIDPTITRYNPTASGSTFRNKDDSTNHTSFVAAESDENHAVLQASTSVGNANDQMIIHATADAEFDPAI